MEKKPEGVFLSLTGIRAVAAYMVFVHHYFGTNCMGKFWCPVVLEMHTGVSIFFVLSGFLITYKYYNSSSLNLNWFKNYYISRLARIYPMFAIVTILTLIILKSPLNEWFLTLTFLKGFSNEYKFIVISQTWTLTVEVVFYILAPLIFLVSKNRGSLALQFILLFLLGLLVSTKGEIVNLSSFISGHIFFFIYTFFGRGFEFLAGILLARMFIGKKIVFQRGKYTYIGLAGIILAIILISSFQSTEFRYGIFTTIGLLIHNFILPVFISILFFGLISEKTRFSQFLSTPLMGLLGKSSYVFYLIHLGVIADLIPKFFRYNMLTFFVTLNVLSVVLYLIIEKPANLGIKKLTGNFVFTMPFWRIRLHAILRKSR